MHATTTAGSNNNAELPIRDRVRGWFPRRCVTELYGEDYEEEEANDDDEVVLMTPSGADGDNNPSNTRPMARAKHE